MESKNPAAKTSNDKKIWNLSKKTNRFEGFSKVQNMFFERTETSKRTTKKSNMKRTQLFMNANTFGVQFQKKLQDASRHVHHIRDKKYFIDSANPAAKTNIDKK